MIESGSAARLCYNAAVTSTQLPRAFTPAWLGGEAAARAILPAHAEQSSARIGAVRGASTRRAAADLVDELAAQHSELPSSPARSAHLEMLAAGGVATVISGQQVGLFTGPAFTLYKAAGVVAAARKLSAESGVPCVPIFWLQTEDHDWPEIDHCFVRSRSGEAVRVQVDGGNLPPRVSVAERRFGSNIESSLELLETALAGWPFAADVLALLGRHYVAGARPASAFRGVLAELFHDEGLLFFDPRTARVAALARPVFERTLRDAHAISASLERRAEAISAAGYLVQVPVRANAPLCFFHPDGPAGPRYRLEPSRTCSADAWRLCATDREIARGEAEARLAEDPQCVSSSALLRPAVQDSLFPSAMYLGGPAEIAYFAQLAPLYDALGVAMPMVAPRPSFCVTDAGDRRRLEAVGVRFADLAGSRDALIARLARVDTTENEIEQILSADFAAKLDELGKRAIALDANLAAPVAKTRATVEQAVRRLADKYRRSAADRDTVLGRRIDSLRAALAPGGVPQERCYGLASLAAQHGIDDLLSAMHAALAEPSADSLDSHVTRELAL